MVDSINSSSAAGVRGLGQSMQGLNGTQGRISTGLRVSSPKQDAALFAIATQISGDLAGNAAVRSSFNQAEATVGTALAAGQVVNNLLTDMKAKAIQANDPSLDDASRQAVDQEFQQLAGQLNTVVSSASFSGTNLIESGAEDMSVLTNADGGTLTVGAQDLSSGGLGLDGVSLGTPADAANALSAIDGAINTASAGVAQLGSSAQSIENQAEFATSLDNVLREGLGNIVDANLGQESAALAAEKVKTELGLRSLAIANAGPQAMRSLFPGGSS